MIVRKLKASSIDRDAHRDASLAEARAAAAAFPGLVSQVLAIFHTVYPPHIIATIACWGLSHASGPGGVSATGMIKGIEQHHVELLQALLLTLDRRDWGSEAADPPRIQLAIDTLKELATAFHRRRILQLEDVNGNADQLVAVAMRERVRDHTQMVRNWGCYDDMRRIIRELHTPLDDQLTSSHGFSATDLVEVADSLVALYQERLNARFMLLKDIFSARTRKAIVYGYFERYEGVAGDPDAFLASLPKRMPLAHLKVMLCSHADHWLIMEMRIDPADVAAQTGKPVELVTRIFTLLSLAPGSLASEDPERLFLANPVWLKPGLHVDEDFLFFTPQSIMHFLPTILRGLAHEAGLAKQLEKRRSAYLESELARVVGSALPGARLMENVSWDWEGVRYETDLIAVIDRVVLIAEAKSGILTPSGLRGAPDSIRKHVKKLLVDPAVQSSRLRDIFRAAQAGDCKAIALCHRIDLGIDVGEIGEILRLSVTLDDFSPLASSKADLKRAGWFPGDVDLPPTMGLADLFTCADILENPICFLHYLTARSAIQSAGSIFGDELDYLGTYLQSGLALPEIVDGSHTGMFSGMSLAIDRYHMSLSAAFEVVKPAPNISPLMNAMLTSLQVRAAPGWTTKGLGLLDAIPPGSELDLEAALDELAEEVAANWTDPDHSNVIAATGHGGRTIVIFHVFPQALEDQLPNRLADLAAEAIDCTGADRCIIFARMLERWHLSYDTAVMAKAPPGSSVV